LDTPSIRKIGEALGSSRVTQPNLAGEETQGAARPGLGHGRHGTSRFHGGLAFDQATCFP
jgi:hypothetical protein